MEYKMAPEEQGQEGSDDFASEIANSLTAAAEQPTVDVPAPEATDPAAAAPIDAPSTEQPRERGDHPAWARFRETLGDDAYGQIKPYLAEMSDEYHKHVTKANADVELFTPYRDYLQMEGMTPDFLSRAVDLGLQASTDPIALYQRLEGWLTEQGLLEEVGAGEDPIDFGTEGEDPRYAQLEQQFAEAQAKVDEMQERFNQAAQAAELQHHTAIAQEKVTTQLNDLRTEHSWIDAQTAGLIIERAQQMLAQTGKMPDLKDAAAPFIQMRQAALSTPRANATAPRLPGSGGGIPSGGKSLSQTTREDDINFMADALRSK